MKAGAWDMAHADSVTHGTMALGVLGYLESGDPDRARAALDSTIDAGISAHWAWVRNRSIYADSISDGDALADLVEFLVERRRAQPSTAAEETPHMNQAVSDYLAYLESGEAAR